MVTSCWRNYISQWWIQVYNIPPLGTLWGISSDGYRWVHPDGVITTSPDSSPFQVRSTLQTAEGYITVTLSPYGNGSVWLVGVGDGWLSRHVVQKKSITPDGMQATYRTYFRRKRFSHDPQWSRFHPNVVGMSRSLCCQLLKGIFYKTWD